MLGSLSTTNHQLPTPKNPGMGAGGFERARPVPVLEYATRHMSERLSRELGFWSSIGIVIGITIGSGIFRTPAAIAVRVPSAPLILAVWTLGGILSLCGALSVAE